ncbi:endonuclease [Gilliamella sp. B2973]|uniref:endonuclease n=1 Tax=Gilliamella sp. B2973 TaxID=2817986 RepID=UPI00226A637C|nr:endonuclease [Gilliamella sp. B2973]MCX8688896.1 endonuclease [Gilliamella sp. B2973]
MDFIKKVVLVYLFILFASSTAYAKNCKKGIPCGNSCISAAKTCRIGTYSAAPTLKPKTTPITPTATQVAISKQNFNAAKTKLVQLYKSNPEQTTFYCDCEFSWTGKKGIVDFSKCGYEPRKNLNRASRIEWEHVMPAENFGRHLQCWRNGGRKECKKDVTFNEMEGDLHNLQPSIGEVNGDRSNYRYSQFTNAFTQYGQCKSAVDFQTRKFQPREEIRGIIARTYFYMSDKYNINLSDSEHKLMTAWNKTYPPDNWECNRNKLIEQIQGNDNKFVTQQCN